MLLVLDFERRDYNVSRPYGLSSRRISRALAICCRVRLTRH